MIETNVRRTLHGVLLVMLAGGVASADPRHVLVLRADGNADAATKTKIDAQIVKLAKNLDGNIEAGEITFTDAAAAVGCSGNEAQCRDEVLGTMGVDEVVSVSVAAMPSGDLRVQVHRIPKGAPIKDAQSTIPSGQASDVKLAADVGPIFGVKATKPAGATPPPAGGTPPKGGAPTGGAAAPPKGGAGGAVAGGTAPPKGGAGGAVAGGAAAAPPKGGAGGAVAGGAAGGAGTSGTAGGGAGAPVGAWGAQPSGASGSGAGAPVGAWGNVTGAGGAVTGGVSGGAAGGVSGAQGGVAVTPTSAGGPPDGHAAVPVRTAQADPNVTAAPNGQVTTPADTRRSNRAVVGLAIGGGLVALSFILWAEASSTQNDINNAPVKTPTDFRNLQDLESRGDTYAGLGNLFFIGGLVVGGVSGYYFWKDRRAHASSQARLTPALFDHGAGLALTVGGAP